MSKTRIFILAVAVIATLLFQLAMPAVARADDGVPPPADPATVEVPPDPVSDTVPMEVISADEIPTEAAPDAGTDTTPTEAVSTDAPTPEVAPTDAPLMGQVPEGTEVVVLNADGSVEPLATQSAAEAIAASDPIWCPSTASGPADPSCTSSQPTVNDLLDYLDVNSTTYFGDGTIYFTTDYNTDDVYIYGYDAVLSIGDPRTEALGNLAIVGDTGGGAAANLTVPVFVWNWQYNVQINNLNMDLSAYPDPTIGLYVQTTGDITVVDVGVTDAGYEGAYLENDTGTGNVSVTSSDFSSNGGTGLGVWTTGTITVDSVTASSNTNGAGADLNADNQIDVSNSTFNDNDYYGLFAGTSSGDVNLTNVTASNTTPPGPQQYGAIVGTDAGNVQVTGGTFNFNTTGDPEYPGIGLQAGTSLGNVTFTGGVTANGNDIGAMAGSEQGNVVITTGIYSDNTDVGLAAGTMQGTITLTDVIANNTTAGQDNGVILGNMEGAIEIYGGQFNGNTSMGVYIQSTGLAATDPDVTLSGLEASGNGLKGVYVGYYAPCGTTTGGVDVDLNSGDFENNGAFGIYAAVGPDGSLNIVAPPFVGNNGGAIGTSIYDIVVDYSVQTCPPPEPPKPEPKPYNIVNVPETGGEPVEQNCADYSGTVLILPDGDKAILTCPSAGGLTLASLSQSNLPGSLPQGPQFISAFQFGLTDGGQPVTVLTGGGVLKLAFKLPEDAKPTDHYAILYWDPTAGNGAGGWLELPNFIARLDGSPLAFVLHPDLSPDDGMRILSGTRVYGDYVKATVNFTGVFVLVKK